MLEKQLKSIDSWPLFLKAFVRINQRMENELKVHDLPDLQTYDLLWTLEQAPKGMLRFNELGERVFLSRYNVTRIAKKLEHEGLIKRQRCPSDKRGLYAVLTEEGRALRQKIWKVYSPIIKKYFSDLLNENEHKTLIALLRKVYQD
ncbi:MAG: MarR family transcriptional regulator [Bacteriovoracaceae bacterium]